MERTEWNANFPGIKHYSFFFEGYYTYVNYILDFDAASQTARYAVEVESVVNRSANYTDSKPEIWDVTTSTALVNGTTYKNEAISIDPGDFTYLEWESNTTNWMPLLDTKNLNLTWNIPAPYKIYRTVYQVQTVPAYSCSDEILAKNPIRGKTAYFDSDPYRHSWTIQQATLHTNSGIHFEIRGTYFDITPDSGTTAPPPVQATYRHYLMDTDDGGIPLDDSNAGLTADTYLI